MLSLQNKSVAFSLGLVVCGTPDYVERAKDLLDKSECTGKEIMTELLGHLRIAEEREQILKTSTCIPCMMPFITSQFLRRERGDRPQILPRGLLNLAFVGQFCELPDNVVFTFEYSVHSAQVAVSSLLGLKRERRPSTRGSSTRMSGIGRSRLCTRTPIDRQPPRMTAAAGGCFALPATD